MTGTAGERPSRGPRPGWPRRRRGRAPARGPVWRALVPVVALAAGALFATTAHTARGTDLRSPETVDLAGTVRAATDTVSRLSAELASVQRQVDAQTAAAGRVDARIAAVQGQVDALSGAFGITGVGGTGLVVTLDDAPPDAAGELDPSSSSYAADLDELVIHQSDLQAVVNAVWAGGAQAVAVAGQRLVPTSAIRCVGNTLLLGGRVYSPPYRVAAIGPSAAMRGALDRSPGVSLLRQAAAYYGVGYAVSGSQSVTVPAYAGPLSLSYATPR